MVAFTLVPRGGTLPPCLSFSRGYMEGLSQGEITRASSNFMSLERLVKLALVIDYYDATSMRMDLGKGLD